MSKERLVELLRNVEDEYNDDCEAVAECGYKSCPLMSEYFADKILADGWIRPPCKVGDVVYIKALKERLPFVVTQISIKKSGIYYEADRIRNKKGNLLYFHDITSVVFDDTDIGKSVFLTREEAEKKLEEGESK